jgi:large subunit ribosomal protein L4
MSTALVYNLDAEKIGEESLKDDIFNIDSNESCIYEAVVAHLKNKRAGSASVKNRALVKGSGKKQWRQKGTGRARSGTRKNPIWRGGGVIFGPQPKNYNYRLTKKKKRLAIKSVLSDKLRDNSLILLDDVKMDVPKTKTIEAFLDKLNYLDKILFIVSKDDAVLKKSVRNLWNAKVINQDNINTYDLLNAKKLIIKKDVIPFIEENLK